jgi:RNA polymerase primary sigma factor
MSRRSPYDSDSTLSLYMRHVGEVPLLTINEEIALAARIKAGDEIAREHMIRANLRLVVKIAREYENLGLPLLDIINEGNIGLIKAVERFDPAKGGKLSTYGSWWIKQSIRRALANQSKTIRLPVHVVDKLCKIRRAAALLHEELGREPTDEELATEMHMPAWRIAEMRAASVRPASLDAAIGEDESARLGDVVEDENAIDPFQDLQDRSMTHMVLDFVEELPEREAVILRRRFGLDGDKEETLEEIGHRFGVTRERIRQLQNIALTKLRRRVEKLEETPEAA